jgi:glycosyl hydrolase family 115 (putative glucuronidase)
MTRHWRHRVLFLVSCCLVPGRAASQTDHPDPWAAPARGSWVRGGAGAAGDVVLASQGSGAEIVVGAAEPLNVRQAATFLAGDIETISGYRPPLVSTPTPGKTSIRLVTLGTERLPSVIDASRLRGQWEAYRVVTAPGIVWLVGSNPRGTAFAAYTLSERLGVDPLYLWTGYVPEHHDPLVLKATRFAQGPPAFKYRGFFHDDEDILPRPFDARGYPLVTGDVPLAWYRRFFETALRLRMNMVAPYVRVHRRFEVQQLASDWGLYYTSHHYDILVSNPFGMTTFNLAAERGVRPDYDWFTNRDGLLTYWRGGVEENHDLDVIWPVGLRNTSDRAYSWPDGTTDADKARVFREVIGLQTGMVRAALPPGRTPIFHFTMYSEMLDLYARDPAAFGLPDDVIIVWPDDNNGHMRALPTDRGRWKHGVYYHLAYLGVNLSKQTTHIVAPATITGEFQKIVQAGATEYMLVNVSELRDYVMGARLITDITWNAPAVYAAPDPAARFVAWWTREYFSSSAERARATYDRYHALLDTPDKLWYASDATMRLVERLWQRVTGHPFAAFNPDTLAVLQERVVRLDSALSAEAQAESTLRAAQQQFFSVDAALGLRIDERQTRAALLLADALAAPDSIAMWRQIRAALTPLEQLEVEFARAEYPPFDRWYQQTWIRAAGQRNNPHRAYEVLRAFIASGGRSPPPPGFGPPPRAAGANPSVRTP